MPLSLDYLPLATPLDPTEEPPGSIDPLGTLTTAERLADIILPGLTARMWRARLLTFTALSAAIADRVVNTLGNREGVRLEARLAFERLYVSAIIRISQKDPGTWTDARRNLPGTDLARRALSVDEPLTRNNFLKGQAVNGPCGVMTRLARQIGLVDEEGQSGCSAMKLLLAWSEDQQLPGVLDDEGSIRRPGAVWVAEVTRVVITCIEKDLWPGAGQKIWEQLASVLRVDRIGSREREVLLHLLQVDDFRRRMCEILRNNVTIYWQADRADGRGGVERTVFQEAITPALKDDSPDRMIAAVSFAIEAYEATIARFQYIFNVLLRRLKHHDGRAVPTLLFEDVSLIRDYQQVVSGLGRLQCDLERAVECLRNMDTRTHPSLLDSLMQLHEETVTAVASPQALVEMLLSRHERVQREKRKAAWIERGRQWTLMPGFCGDEEASFSSSGVYLHPFRIVNVYSMLADLGQIEMERTDAEE